MNTESRLSQHRFMDSVTNIVIGEVKRNYRFDKRVDVKIQREKSAIHVILKRFRDYFEVLISKEGNIDIIVQGIEPHGPIRHRYYIWEDFDDHNELLLQVKKDMKLLIRDFFDGMEGYILCDPRIYFSLQGGWYTMYELLRCYGLSTCYDAKKINELKRALRL